MPAQDAAVSSGRPAPLIAQTRHTQGAVETRAIGSPAVVAEAPAVVEVAVPFAPTATSTATQSTTAPVTTGVDAPVATIDAPVDLLADTPSLPADSPILRARCDDIARRIIRDGGAVSVNSLAREVGSAPATIKRLMATATFRRIYDEVADELLGTIDERIANERLDVLSRQDSLQRRALTVLADCLDIAQRHKKQVVDNGAVPRPGLLKMAVDAAAEIRQVGIARGGGGGGGGATSVNINITRNQATIIQGAIRESGIDLSDVLDGVVLDVTAKPIEKAG